MEAAADDPMMATRDLWKNIKSRIFQTFTIWEIIQSKVHTQQPDNSNKWLHRLFEEIECIMEMFQVEISNSCRITVNENSTSDVTSIMPGKNISKFLGVSPHNTRIYLSRIVDECNLAMTASQLVNVQLKTDVSTGYKPSPDDEESAAVFVKTEIKSEDPEFQDDSEFQEDFETAFEEDDDKTPLAKKQKVLTTKKEKLAFLRSQEYSPSFPVSQDDFEKMKTGAIEKKCPKCEKTFVNKFEMIRHFRAKKKDCQKYVKPRHDLYIRSIDEATGTTKYSCSSPKCSMSETTWKGMTPVFHHWEEMHSDKIDLPIVCEHCPPSEKKRFLVSATLNKHVAWAHPEKVGREHKCSICGKSMNNLKKLQRHEKTHENDEARTEDYRYRQEYPVSEMEFEQMKAGVIPKKCPKCGKTFKSTNKIIKHFVMKRRDCSSFVQVRSDLSIDVKDEATGKIKFACAFPNCPDSDKAWLAKMDVSRHWESKHSESIDMTVACEYCPKRFLLTATHKIHMRTIHPEKLGLEYHCSKCGKKLKNLKMLIMHEKTHSTDTFHCDFCDYKSNTQAHKNQHMKYNHADKLGIEIKVYHCEHCGKECRHKSNLRQHIESAHSINPDPKYKCQICGKQLKQDNSFRKHMANVHGVGERCNLCNKLYKNEEALEKHMKGVH